MRYSKLLENLGSTRLKETSFRRYSLSEIISESYKSLYDSKKGSNLQRLAEAHLEDVRHNPTEVERLSRQLCKIKTLASMVESKEIKDEELLVPEEKYDTVEPKEKEIKESKDEKMTPDEMKKYWESNKDKDPILANYKSYDEWYKDSKENGYVEDDDDDDIEESTNSEDSEILEDTELTDEEIEELSKYLTELRKTKSEESVREGRRLKRKVTESSDKFIHDEDLEEGIFGNSKKKIEQYEKAIKDIYDSNSSYVSSKVASDVVSLLNDCKIHNDFDITVALSMLKTATVELKKHSLNPIKVLLSLARKYNVNSIYEDKIEEFQTNLSALRKSPGVGYDAFEYLTEKVSKAVLDRVKDFTKFLKTNESLSYDKSRLSNFSKKSSGKAFVKTFKKLDAKLREGTALTRQESISLYKAANSAMTHLSVELEHNPEFLPVFKESITLLSADVSKLLESMKKDKAPSKATMKSLAKFSEAILREDDEEELPPIEDEEESIVSEEEVEQFDQEYAEARVELHKELAGEHADDENPEIAEKLEQDAEEITNLPGVTDEQIAEVQGEEVPADQEDEEIPGEEIEEKEELSLDDEDITDDELAELKKHLTEMRKSRQGKSSKVVF